MTRIRSYHRPATIDEAVALLDARDVVAVPLGGGTVLNARGHTAPEDVVDLQALGLDTITRDGAALHYGAMVRLQDIVDHEWTPPVMQDLARIEAPSTLRNAATVGGTVAAADWESPLLAGLLAYEATARVVSASGTRTLPVADLVADRRVLAGAIIVDVALDVSGRGGFAKTGRTPADRPIVLVAGRRDDDGAITLAATGVASSPMVIDAGDLAALDPPGDFRGTSAYRRHLAGVLSDRVLAELEGGDA